MRICFKHAQVWKDGSLRLADILVSDGRIVSIGDRVSCPTDTVCVEVHNAVIFPGFVDVHVHLREPGFSYKETVRTGTLAAAHGGFAHVAAMPNLNPVPDCKASLEEELRRIRESACVHVHPDPRNFRRAKGRAAGGSGRDGPGGNCIFRRRKGRTVGEPDARGDGAVQKAWENSGRALRGRWPASRRLYPRRRMCERPTATGAFAPRASGARLRAMCAWQRRQAVHIMCATSPRRGSDSSHPGGKTVRRECNMRDRAALSDLYGG